MSDTFYTLHDTYQGYIKVVDASRGVQVGTISPRGKVLSPFQISNNQASFLVELPDQSKLGCVYKLPSGQLVNTFRA